MNDQIQQAARAREIEHAAFLDTVALVGLLPAWVVNDPDYFTDIACETCARDWAEREGLIYESQGGYYRSPNEDDAVESSPIWPGDNETDSPSSCGWCGYFVNCRLTSEGVAYVRENMPAGLWYLWGVQND